jgi:hypothetical protein
MRSVLLSDLKGVDKKTLDMLKKAGVESLDDLKLLDAPQLSNRTGVSETLSQEILLRAELQAYKVPPDIADALVASNVIGRVGELAAFDPEEIQALLAKGAKPGEAMDFSIEAIEAWKAHVPRLSLDEETTQGVLLEETTTALHDEAEPALRAEEPVVSKREVEALIAGLERTLQQLSGKMQTILTAPEETIEFANVQALLSSLQADIQSTLVQVMGKVEPDLGVVMGEDQAPALADEEMEAEVQIQALSQKLATIQGQLAELQVRRIAADEELSPTAAEEEEPTAPRGE